MNNIPMNNMPMYNMPNMPMNNQYNNMDRRQISQPPAYMMYNPS